LSSYATVLAFSDCVSRYIQAVSCLINVLVFPWDLKQFLQICSADDKLKVEWVLTLSNVASVWVSFSSVVGAITLAYAW